MLEIVAEDVLVGLVMVRAEGRVTAADYKDLRREVDRLVSLHGPLDLIVDLRALEGFSAPGALADLAFDATHQASLRHVAVVGGARMETSGASLGMPLLKPEARWFATPEEARAWISETHGRARDSE